MGKVLAIIGLMSDLVFGAGARESKFMVGLGPGLPQLAGIEAAYRLFPNWQMGLSYGLIPGAQGGISPGFAFESQNVKLANDTFVTFDKPTVSTTLTSLCPFVRFYPNPSAFYVQLTVGLLQAKNDFKTDILDITGTKITDAKYEGVVTVTQIMPTLSMGRVFSSEMFFFNVNLGVTIVASAIVDTSITSDLPDRLGGNSANQPVLDDLKNTSQSAIDSGLQAFRNEVLFLPSFLFAFGFMF